MTKYVAFLRGIMPTNPNMRNDKLRQVFESLGFQDVQTVINSGNVIFSAKSQSLESLESKIERALAKQLGLNIPAIVRSQQQLQKLVDQEPFKGREDTPHSRLNVTFLKTAPAKALKLPHRPDGKSYEIVGMSDQAIFSVIDLRGDKTPDLMLWLEKQYSKNITTRTWKTIGRILKKL